MAEDYKNGIKVDRNVEIDLLKGPYSSVAEANAKVTPYLRSVSGTTGLKAGRTVIIDNGTTRAEYWWDGGIADTDLVAKSTGGGAGTITSVNGQTGPVVILTSSDISGVETLTNKGTANGYAPLASDSRVPRANSYKLTSPTPVSSAIAIDDDPQTIAEKLQGQFNDVAYAKFSNATVQNFLTNITANGGSISPTELGAADYFIQGLGTIGITANCVFANLGLGDYLAASSNLIYQSTNKYMVGVGGTLTSGNWDRNTGWIRPSGGVTHLDTNFNLLGYNIAAFTTVCGLSMNSSNNTRALFGFGTGHGLVKTKDDYGFNVAAFNGKTSSNIKDMFETLANSQGNHILVQGATTCQWYRDGILVGSSSSSTTGTFTTNNMLIGGTGVTYALCFNKALSAGEADKLNTLMNSVQAMVGRPNPKLNLKSIVFEGTSQSASYVPPTNTYSPLYCTQVLNKLINVDVNNTLVAQPAKSGKLAATMLTDATSNTNLYNTANYNNKQNNVFIFEGGINDMGLGSVQAADFVYDTYIVPTLQNRIAAGYTVLVETIPSFGGNCTYTSFLAGGLANYNSASTGSRRLNYRIKTDIRNYNGVNAHGVILSDEVPEFQDATNVTYFQDGLHYTGAGSVGAAPIRAGLVADQINKCLGRKVFTLKQYQSEIPQYITGDITPSSASVQSSYRTFKNYLMVGTFNFTLPDPMLFVGTEYVLQNISGTQTIIGTINGVLNLILTTLYQVTRIKAVQTGTNTFEWVTQ